jgi:signal transduction histidine kinase
MRLGRYLASLRVQVTAAFVALLLLVAAAGLYAVGAFQRQLAYDSLVDIAGRLELTVEKMHAQGMNYVQNAPRDYATYYRDVRLYYQDLLADVATFDEVVDTFMRGDFGDMLPMTLPWIRPRLEGEVADAVHHLEQVWKDYRAALFAALGEDEREPRLEWAAEHVMAEHEPLAAATEALSTALRHWTDREYRLMIHGAVAVGAGILLLSLLLLAVLNWKALAPLRGTMAGFQRVAAGDFGHRLPVTGATEVRDLTISFNRLSERLDLLYQLIQGLQQGQDLDQLVGVLGGHFRELLGCDWIGVVFVDDARASAQVETSWLDGAPQSNDGRLYRLQGTLLEDVLADGSPLDVPDLPERARANPAYEFLRHLAALDMRDAIFLPLTRDTGTPVPAVLVFATRRDDGFDATQRRLLGNSAQLLAQGFARIARYAEQGRLAAIGEFASGIAHELRTPLSTVSLALDHLAGREQDERARRRIELGIGEVERMRRLLDDMLLYAKPLMLELRAVEPGGMLASFIGEVGERYSGYRVRLGRERGRGFDVDTDTQTDALVGGSPDGGGAMILVDPERMRQVFTNLTDNACQAAPPATAITWSVADDINRGAVTLSIHNAGEPIPPHLLPRLTEPFFSTRTGGTGLGLAIVRRLVEQQGGRMEIRSDANEGTRVELRFPRTEAGVARAGIELP